jgi:16S rRNA (uracil1498-N3)-methyltransferase
VSKIRIYIEPEQISNTIEIEEKGIIHKIKDVLRLKDNDDFYVFDGQGKEYLYRIKEAKKKHITIEQKALERKEDSSGSKIILGFPIEREERVDFILQKATELGVFSFVPFICQRSIRSKPSEAKLKRWQKIVIEATRQSQRLWLPQIHNVLGFDDILKINYPVKLAGAISGETVTAVLEKGTEEVFIVIGPVGDFSDEEYTQLEKNSFKFIKLSSDLLRVETAAVFSVGLIKYFLDTE